MKITERLRAKVVWPVLVAIWSCSWATVDASEDNQTAKPPLKTEVGSTAWITEIRSFIPNLLSEANVPGLSIAVVKNDQIVWNGSFGVKSTETKESVNDSTVFQAASLSKTCFAYLVMKLVEQGRLDLDTPLWRYFSEDYIENEDRDRLITARIVLSHTTGLPNWRPRGDDLKIHFTPGEKFSYSGEGYVYLQKAVEQLTGLGLNQLMRQLVFEPLDMRHSSYEWRERYQQNYAVGHSEFGQAIRRDPMTEANAAYSLYTTARDYATFLLAILNNTGLPAAAIRDMLTPQIQLDENCLNCTSRPPSKLSEENAWGLGWGLQTTDQGTSFWHWGDQGIFRCYTVAFQNQKIGLVYFTNSENGLSIRNEVILKTLGGTHPALSWLHYDSHDSPAKKFTRLAVTEGWDQAKTRFDSLKAADSTSPVFSERTLNRLGYHFLRSKQFDRAIDIFELNVKEYPESWNVYDSLAEAYMKNGQSELAIKYYEKSLLLNPDNSNGRKKLEELTKK